MEYLPESRSSYGYVNESERNVHVWCSLVQTSKSRQFRNQPTLGLIGGCFVRTTDGLEIYVFYKWLNKIIVNIDPRSLVLFPCSNDPRLISPLQIGPLSMPSMPFLPRDSQSCLREGHYLLFQRTARGYQAVWPDLVDFEFVRRSVTRSQSCTPSPNKPVRDTTTRRLVRQRDQACKATGQRAHARSRGANFTGLEVAHIFPISGANTHEWKSGMGGSTSALVQSTKLADRPLNAILLRADVHAFFDDYQWSVLIEQGNTLRTVRFEKSGASFLDDYESSIDLNSATLGTIEGPSLPLLDHHLFIALSSHVRGFGRRRRADVTMI